MAVALILWPHSKRKGHIRSDMKANLPMIPRTAKFGTVAYLAQSEVKLLCETVQEGRNGVRNSLLIKTLFQCALRISECLSLTPAHLQKWDGRQPVIEIIGKGNKRRMVSIPQRLVDQLRAFAFQERLTSHDRFFKINRSQAWRVITTAARKTGFTKRIHPHLFRHSGSIERLKQTGNPKSLQMFLGHSSPQMTMRYLSTLSAEDSLAIEGQVEFDE